MKLITLDELKQIADSHKLTLTRNDRSTCTIRTDIAVAKDRFLRIQFSYNNESYQLFKDVYNVTTFLTEDTVNNNWSVSENQIYIDTNHRINLKFIVWDENESFDDYYGKIKKQVEDKLNAYTLRQKKNSVELKKFEIVNEETLGKFRDLAANDKNVEFREKDTKIHEYTVNIRGSKSRCFYIYERPKLGKWDIKFDRFYHKAFRVDTFEEAYDIVNWWLNSPKFEWLSV